MPHKQKPTQGRYGREWHDGKAHDGFTVNGWRRIAKSGYIRFCQGADISTLIRMIEAGEI